VVKAVVLVAVMVGGCSFATMHSPHGSPPECTESSLAPIVDIGVAIASPFLVYALLSENAQPSSDPDNASVDRFIRGVAAVGLSFPVWGAFGTSSIYGFIKSDRCTRAKRDYQQLMAAPPGPGPYAPPPRAPGPYAPGPYPPPPMPAPPPQ
jgi:hypothetical protein